ncbi:MAG: alpha/beta hydrolase [Candidatus Obscuribacterales bacterium]|nr:alpha/beta hydrolase [Candidatus Obscuribacterales bacterium]
MHRLNSQALFSREVIFGKSGWKLPGTITMPCPTRKRYQKKNRLPAIVMVHSSGAHDRDNNIGPNKPFQEIAEGLASHGIACLRYEKRTYHYAEKLNPNGIASDITINEEVLEDALAAIAFLRKQPNIDPKRIFVLGLSWGGMWAPRLATMTKALAGLLILAAPNRTLEDIYIDYFDYMHSLKPRPNEQDFAKLVEVTNNVSHIKSDALGKPGSPSHLFSLPACYWQSVRGYIPVNEARKVTLPMLILQGERDYQSRESDFVLWKRVLLQEESRTNVTCKYYKGLNHYFMEGEGEITPDEYQRKGTVVNYVISDIASWIKQY